MPEEKVKQYECLCPCEHETGCIACENGNHDYHIVPPAADAGPRQSDAAERAAVKIVVECCEGVSDRNLGDYVANVSEMIRKEYATAAAPVSQEAAPGLTMPPSLTMVLDKLAAIESKATAPDWAMRVARKFCDEAFTEHNPTLVETWRNRLAALIRQAGSEREPHSSQVHTDLTVRCSKCKGTLIWRYFEEKDEIEVFHNCNDSNQELRTALLTAKELVEPLIETDSDLAPEWDAGAKTFVAEASRLLGGE